MTKPSNQHRLRNALPIALVIIGVLATGLLLSSGAAPRRAESGLTDDVDLPNSMTLKQKRPASSASAPQAEGYVADDDATSTGRPGGRTDAGDLVPGRPSGGYGFGGGSLMGLPIVLADGPQQGSQNQPAVR